MYRRARPYNKSLKYATATIGLRTKTLNRAWRGPTTPHANDSPDDIAAPDMEGIGLVFSTQMGNREGRDERPVAETDQWVPYKGAVRTARCPDGFTAGHR